jgi:hypothetical protein
MDFSFFKQEISGLKASSSAGLLFLPSRKALYAFHEVTFCKRLLPADEPATACIRQTI